jgi:hypothetical protein
MDHSKAVREKLLSTHSPEDTAVHEDTIFRMYSAGRTYAFEESKGGVLCIVSAHGAELGRRLTHCLECGTPLRFVVPSRATGAGQCTNLQCPETMRRRGKRAEKFGETDIFISEGPPSFRCGLSGSGMFLPIVSHGGYRHFQCRHCNFPQIIIGQTKPLAFNTHGGIRQIPLNA